MDCIFKKSKYYAAAVADPSKIIEPIGYQFFTENNLKKPEFKKKDGKLINKYVSDKTIMKIISSRGIPNKQLLKFLKRSQSTRKNYYLEGTKQEFITQRLSYSLLIQLRSHFFRLFQDKQILQFLQLMQCLSLLNQNMFSIKDYALSTFIVYYRGTNKKFYDYLQETLRQQFLEYDSQILINEPKISRPQLRKMEFKSKNDIIDYTNEVNSIASEKDKHFSGAHLFISHNLPQFQANDLFSEQILVWKYIFDQIIIMMGHLGEGQHGVLKIKGTYSHKTSQLLFMMKLAFSKLWLQKSILSNPFNNQNYVLCQYFNKQNGRIILDHIFNNYDEIIKNNQILLIDPSSMHNGDFQNNLKIYNDLSIITKNTTKQLYKDFALNSNMDIYPNKQELLTKLSQLKTNKIDQYIEDLKNGIPEMVDENKKMEKKQDEIMEKVAEKIDFDMFNFVNQNTQKKSEKNIHDISKGKGQKSEIEDYLAVAEKNINKKKQKPKKKKVQKTDDY